jgi:signal-transduction protein with cAMP-binding, CBS, and nucleotidyltransferase domain
MFDFDVLGISEPEERRPSPMLGLSTVHLSARLGDLARAPATTVAPETSIGAAAQAVGRSARGAAVVVRNQRPAGVVTSQDLLAQAPRELAVVTVMTACREPLRTSDTVGEALRRMCLAGLWHMPLVCERGLFVGAIDIADLTLWLRDRMTLLSVDAALGTPWASNETSLFE